MSKDWLKDQGMTPDDRKALEKGGELSDRIIAASIALVRKEHKHLRGLQDTVLWESMRILLANRFKTCVFNPNRLENIHLFVEHFRSVEASVLQIHFDGKRHWLVSSSLEGELKVIDSLNAGVNKDVRRQLQQIYESRVVNGKLKINVARCQVSFHLIQTCVCVLNLCLLFRNCTIYNLRLF